ncbi:MAG: inositol monophosphatase [Acidimicrobiia bacterium]|nr:inositol monophosphatase [Acidimicrobiia bacterium]
MTTSAGTAGALELFGKISDACAAILAVNEDWGLSGERDTQYSVDLLVDAACVPLLLAAGYSVLSEESGLQHPPSGTTSQGVVVVDPLDGSTNASLGLPWCNTALCLVEEGVPTVAMVTNLVTGERFTAVRGLGATRDGVPISVGAPVPLSEAIIAGNGVPSHRWGWRQFRAMGAAALDICTVAGGGFDGYVDMTPGEHGVWDYIAGLLIVEEAGGIAVDAFGRELVVVDPHALRAPVVASNRELLDELLAARLADE